MPQSRLARPALRGWLLAGSTLAASAVISAVVAASPTPETAPMATIRGVVELSPASADHPTHVTIESLDATTLDYRPITEVPLDDRGRFSFEHPAAEPDLLRLSIGRSRADLVLDAAESIQVTLRPRSAGGALVEGSSGNRRLDAFRTLMSDRNRHYFDELKAKGDAAVAAGRHDDLEAMEAERDERLANFYADLGRELDAMGSSASVVVALSYLDVFLVRDLFTDAAARLRDWNPDAKITRSIEQTLARAKLADAGATAPSFVLADRTDRTTRLEDFRGRWLLVDFWASWCLNCRLEMPRLVTLYETFHDRGFDIVGITPNDTRAAWSKTIDDERLPWTNLWDGERTASEAYQVGGQLPASFLIDPSGKIVARNLSSRELRQALEARLGSP